MGSCPELKVRRQTLNQLNHTDTPVMMFLNLGRTLSYPSFTMFPGTIKDGGILPRSLALIFNSLQGQLHPTPDLKPVFFNEVIWLDSKQIRQEEMKKLALLSGGLQEVKC